MTWVSRHIAEHRLNVREGCPPVRQKKRSQVPERNKAIQEEVEKLVEAGIMKEVHYHSWLANPVMVKKHDSSWRMCVNFKDLNKACPKDGYPLPKIDWKVESLCGYPFKCFLDAYKGYHQIKMEKEDEEKTTFITSQVYMDGLVIKSCTEQEIIRDIEETFKTLWKINMKLSLNKCTFGVEEGMFLGYMVNTKEIKACPDKVEAVLSLPSLKCLKDVQRLNRRLASLNRFLAKLAEKSLPFFKTLKKCIKKSDFQWTTEPEAAFKQIKKLIVNLPTLTAPMEKEELIVYLAAARKAVLVEVLTEKSINEAEMLTVVKEEGNTWMTPIYEYLTEEILLTKKKKTREVRLKSRRYSVINEVLYKKSFLEPWLPCVRPLQANYVLKEIHEGSCSMHAGPRFGLPGEIISDNGKQFRDSPFKDWCGKLNIRQRFTSVKHPQANDLVERENGSLGKGVKVRLDKGSKDWMEEIPYVPRAHRNMIKSSNEDTPFSLTYGTKAVIPTKIGMPTLRTTEVDMVRNDEALKLNLDLLEEKREQATIRDARSKAKLEKTL
ncbi:reverse transcriptase domain-containing protein [Tanacetum coccineum]